MLKQVEVSDEQIEQAVAVLRAGKLVAFPTETVYGLGADASNVSGKQARVPIKLRSSS